jgi:hypothetical protein
MNEEDVRPKHIFDKYLDLAAQDSHEYFNSCEKEKIKCPACGKSGKFSFIKNEFIYEECESCFTLFVSPRPISQAFNKYYTQAPSVEFWASTFYKETEEARRELLWKPKAKLIYEKIEFWLQSNVGFTIVDIGGGYGIFSEEMRTLTNISPIIIEPGPTLAGICRKKGFTVIEKFLEAVDASDLPKSRKVFVSFELFEHLHSPEEFLIKLSNMMLPNDLFIFTTLSGTGADISVLWENSKSVSPPHHLNFFNPKSIPIILERLGFNTLEITTPGKLDMDIMSNSRDKITNRFWSRFFSMASEDEKKIMQKALEMTCSSSHIMVVCKKNK